MNQYLIPWSHLKIRDSKFFEDQIVLVIAQDTHMIQVDPALRERIYAAASQAPPLATTRHQT